MKERPNDANARASRFLSLFTDNWGLKIISLALAIIIYKAIKNDTANHDRFIQHPLGAAERN